MQLHSALDWQTISAKLRKDLAKLSYNPDLKTMLNNIEAMVKELSKEEVIARRTRRTYSTEKQVDKINKAISHLDKLILIAQIMNWLSGSLVGVLVVKSQPAQIAGFLSFRPYFWIYLFHGQLN